MKKFGVIAFIVCIVIGLAFANFFSFGRLTNNLFNIKLDVGGHVSGSGNISSEKRDVSDFRSVDVSGVFQVEIVAGKDLSVEVQADDNVVPLITTELRGGTLHIELDQKVSTKNEMVVRITSPDIERLESSGASKVTISGVKNDSFSVDTSGASKVTISGETSQLNIHVSGASNIDAEQLAAVKADVDASGASKVAVNVSGELRSQASGASRITYRGEPRSIDNHQSGAGSVSRK
jgi:hypothetical protein